ncbi:MAG: vWA domain-containing protein [Thermotogota bacterium]
MIRFGLPAALAALPALALILIVLRRGKAHHDLLRYATLALVALALADPRLSVRDARNNVVFLVDRSASVARTTSDRNLRNAIGAVVADHPGWSYGVVSFARTSEVDAPLGAIPVPSSVHPDPTGSDLVEGARLALSLLPTGGANQIVVLSDGRFSSDAITAATEAQLASVRVSAIPVGESRPDDVRLSAFDGPREVSVGRPAAFFASVSSNVPGRATIALYRGGQLVEARNVALSGSLDTFTFSDATTEPGFYEYRVVVKQEGDAVPENDARSLVVRTVDHPSVLLVDVRGDSALPSLLQSLGVDFVQAQAVPSLATLSDYRQVIYAGQALQDLTGPQVNDLTHYVKNLGGGLLVVQGDREVRGFEAGPIESLLPVSFSVPEKGRSPSMAIVYLLDRSSSMNELAGDRAKIRVLREAAVASLLLLPGDTLVGIVGFYDNYDWVFPLQQLGDGTGAYRAVAALNAFGGTDIYYPLNDAIDQLIAADVRVKHILLVSDGQTTEVGRDYPQLLQKLDQHTDITLSVIAVNRDPNVPFLRKLVDHGRGVLYYAADFVTLPQVTIEVTQRLSRSRFINTDTAVEASTESLVGLGTIPAVQGYVLTYPRSSASTMLWAGPDPLLSTWRIGLGSVTVLNVDLSGAWSRDWLSWSGMPRLFEEILRTTSPVVTTTAGVTSRVDVGSSTTSVFFDVRTPTGSFDDFLTFAGTLVPTQGTIDAPQVAPGLYRARFSTPAEGAYAFLVQESGGTRSLSVPLTVPYSSEYEAFGVDRDALARLTQATGGALLDEERHLKPVRSPGAEQEKPLFPMLLGAALALFLVDLGLRRRAASREPRASGSSESAD